MATKQRLTDEAIIAALVQTGTIKEAAKRLHCVPRTIYERMKSPEFKDKYNQAKAELVKAATAKLQGLLAGAIDTLVEIKNDKEAAKQTRANCAVAILQYGAKFTESTDIIERLEAVEAAHGMQNAM